MLFDILDPMIEFLSRTERIKKKMMNISLSASSVKVLVI